jgi:hypothetical protein
MRGRRKRGNYFRVARTVYRKSASTGPGSHRQVALPPVSAIRSLRVGLSFPDRAPKSKHGIPIPDVWFAGHPDDVAMLSQHMMVWLSVPLGNGLLDSGQDRLLGTYTQ